MYIIYYLLNMHPAEVGKRRGQQQQMGARTRTRRSLDGRFGTNDVPVKMSSRLGKTKQTKACIKNTVLRNLIPHDTTVLQSRG